MLRGIYGRTMWTRAWEDGAGCGVCVVYVGGVCVLCVFVFVCFCLQHKITNILHTQKINCELRTKGQIGAAR